MANVTNQPHRTGKETISKSSLYASSFGLEKSTAINPKIGGQFGWAPNNFAYLYEQPYIQQQGIFITLSTPSMFSKIKGAYEFHGILKSMMENRTQSFDGVTIQTTANFVDMEFTGGRVLSFGNDATRDLGTPTHRVIEIEGEPYDKLTNVWINYGICDPDLKVRRMVLLENPGDGLIDEVTMSGIYFEPNRNYTDVAHACLALAMAPTNTVQREIKRDKSSAFGLREMDIQFKALMEHDTVAVFEIAKAMFKQMPLYNHTGTKAPSGFTDRTPILKTEVDAGIIEQMVERANDIVNPDYIRI